MARRIANKRRDNYLSRKFGSLFLNERSVTRNLVGDGIKNIYDFSKKRGWEIFLFGGVPRSIWVSNRPVRVRDFDMVVSDECFDDLRNTLSKYLIRENRFGGLKLLIDNIEFDIWSLSSTWAFKTGLVSPAKFEYLPHTVFLNIDSIVFELAPSERNRRRIYQSGFHQAIRKRCLDICLFENPFPLLCAVRALRMAQVMEFKISRRLCFYIIEALRSSDFASSEEVQLNHYGKVFFDLDQILKLIEFIEKQLEISDKNEFNIFGGLSQNHFEFYMNMLPVPSTFSFTSLPTSDYNNFR